MKRYVYHKDNVAAMISDEPLLVHGNLDETEVEVTPQEDLDYKQNGKPFKSTPTIPFLKKQVIDSRKRELDSFRDAFEAAIIKAKTVTVQAGTIQETIDQIDFDAIKDEYKPQIDMAKQRLQEAKNA